MAESGNPGLNTVLIALLAAGVRFGLDIAQEHTKTYMREEVKQLSNLKGDPR